MSWTRRGFLQAFAAVPLSVAVLKARIGAHPDVAGLPRIGSVVRHARDLPPSAIHELVLHAELKTTAEGEWERIESTGHLTFQLVMFDTHVDPGEHLRVSLGGYAFTGLAQTVECDFLHGMPTHRKYFVQGDVVERTIV
jgi:hypothetical protein